MFQNKAVVECNSQIFMTTFILFTLFLVRDCPHFSLTQNLPRSMFFESKSNFYGKSFMFLK